MFTITSDPARGLIQATLAGFFDVEGFQRYAAEAEALIRRTIARRGAYSILLDVSECAIQSQEVVAAFQRHVASVPRAKRCAVVTGDSIIRMQVRRMMRGPTMRACADRVSALEWLRREETAPEPTQVKAACGRT
ncbi:MAG: STAS/SEC14 domain-containing protein [Acetobacteraceae bacterium]|nr:STAS/SEC14 domain-containing protein [Acetobacteraceae bacterium]